MLWLLFYLFLLLLQGKLELVDDIGRPVEVQESTTEDRRIPFGKWINLAVSVTFPLTGSLVFVCVSMWLVGCNCVCNRLRVCITVCFCTKTD